MRYVVGSKSHMLFCTYSGHGQSSCKQKQKSAKRDVVRLYCSFPMAKTLQPLLLHNLPISLSGPQQSSIAAALEILKYSLVLCGGSWTIRLSVVSLIQNRPMIHSTTRERLEAVVNVVESEIAVVGVRVLCKRFQRFGYLG